MKIALAQLNYTIGDIEGNTAKIIDAVEKAEKEDAELASIEVDVKQSE